MPTTWLSLELNPVAIAIAVGPSGASRRHWQAGGPPWANPPFGRDPSVLETGGQDAVKRPVRSANI